MSWADQVADSVLTGSRWLFRFLREHYRHLYGIAAVLGLLLSGVVVYQYLTRTEVTLLTGPAGGTNEAYADTVIAEVKKESPLLGKRYEVKKEPTEGFEVNRSRIEADNTGLVFGFAQDGFGDAAHIRTLLPLNETVLHILCQKDFLEQLRDGSPPSPTPDMAILQRAGVFDALRFLPSLNMAEDWFMQRRFDSSGTTSGVTAPSEGIQFSEIVALIKERIREGRTDTLKQKIYLGPPRSGTRQIADIVLDYYDLDVRQMEAHGISNWNEMRDKLAEGKDGLGLAFSLGPPNDTLVADIARDDSCVLVTLGDDVRAIKQGHEQISHAKLAKHSYTPTNDFCPAEVDTLATRRVLICSKHMKTADAFFLATTTRDALRERVPKLRWGPLATDVPKPPVQLAYQLHPAADLLRNQQSPESWKVALGMWWPLLLPAGLALVGQLAQIANKRFGLQPEQENDRERPSEPPLHGQLQTRINSALHELEHSPFSMKRRDHDKWDDRVEKLRLEVDTAYSDNGINEKQHELLCEGLRELRTELDFFHVPKRASAKRQPRHVGVHAS